MLKPIFWTIILCAAGSHGALADQWTKSFKVGAAPELRVETGDGNVTLRAANVSSIEARVITSGWKIGPGEIEVIDRQSGDHVELNVKFPRTNFSLGNFGHRSVRIEVQIPRQTRVNVHTGDGNIDGEGFEGALDASSGDGNIRVRGKFEALTLRSGDGNIEAEVRPGSRMSSSWTVRSGDGGVTLRLPDGFAADVEAHTGDGRITVDLPLTTSGGIRENSVSGKLNGGGPVLTVHTGDGAIHLARM